MLHTSATTQRAFFYPHPIFFSPVSLTLRYSLTLLTLLYSRLGDVLEWIHGICSNYSKEGDGPQDLRGNTVKELVIGHGDDVSEKAAIKIADRVKQKFEKKTKKEKAKTQKQKQKDIQDQLEELEEAKGQ